MEAPASVRFSHTARRLAVEARRIGLSPPGFSSPPRLAGVPRTIRRWPDGGSVVAVRLAGRPFEVVAADMVEGVVVANRLAGDDAAAAREALAGALEVA